MLNKLKKNNQGFTIIEVMIVLAIAALILLIVFLAVPALQRSSRNTARKTDAGRIATAIANFESNNNGNVPAAASWTGATGQCASILNDAGNFSQATWTSASCATAQAANGLVLAAGAVTPSAQTTGFEVIVSTGASCSQTVPGTSQGASTRQAAILYDLETSSGNYNWACVDAS